MLKRLLKITFCSTQKASSETTIERPSSSRNINTASVSDIKNTKRESVTDSSEPISFAMLDQDVLKELPEDVQKEILDFYRNKPNNDQLSLTSSQNLTDPSKSEVNEVRTKNEIVNKNLT